MYECDMSTVSIPLSETSFGSPVPQRIRFTAVSATLNTALFNSNFGSINTASFDTSFAATLELKCDGNSAVSISSGVFANFGPIVKDFKIINCQVTAAANAFTNLGDLDRFVIENGTIASMNAAAFTSVNIFKDTNPSPSYPVRTGELLFKDSAVAGGSLPSTLLNPLTNLESVTIEGCGISVFSADFFSANTKLRYVSIGHNTMTTIPTALFDGLDSLAEVQLYATETVCSCDNLWMYNASEITRMKIFGDFLCSSPTEYENKKASVYYYDTCVTVTEWCSDDIKLMGACITIIEIVMYGICVIAFIVACVVLGLTIHMKRKMNPGGKGGKGGKKGAPSLPKKRPPPKGAKQGWA